MSNAFDPYHTWLGIAPSEQPPNHYRLLGIALYESDPDVISNAADRQMAHIRTFQSGKYSKESQKILNELSAARVQLLDPKKRAEYDAKLRAAAFAAMPQGMAQGIPQGMTQGAPNQGIPQGMPPGTPGMAPGQSYPPPVGQTALSPQPVPSQKIPPSIPSAPVNLGGRTSSIKKRQKTKEDPTKIYLLGGGIAVAILLLVFLLSSGDSSKETASKTQDSANNSADEAIDPNDFDYGEDWAELPERAVQEDFLSNTSPATSSKPANKSTAAASVAEKESPQTGADSALNKEVVEDFIIPKDENDSDDSDDADDDDDAETKEESEDEESAEDAEDGETEEVAPKPATKKKSNADDDTKKSARENKTKDPGISNDEIMNIGRGVVRYVEPNRSKIVKFYGGNQHDLDQLTLGVNWLMDKSIKAGSEGYFWNFDHTLLFNGKKRTGSKNFLNPGIAKDNINSSTALAMMAILGSGEISTKDFQFLNRAAQFLHLQAKPASKTQQILVAQRETAKKTEASLVEFPSTNKNFHAHAWGTIAICDYLALAHEKKELKNKSKVAQITEFAQALVQHIESQQISDGSFPAIESGLDVDFVVVPASTSMGSVVSTVWNLMALKSAKNAGLHVPNGTIIKATNYLATKVSSLAGSRSEFSALSSSALRDLKTAFFGLTLFGENTPEYAKVAALAERLVPKADKQQLEGNFFATLLIRDLRGTYWENWKEKVVDQYLKEQSSDKTEAGSWFYGGEEVNSEGGRLYCTAMTLLILETIYRYEPLRPLDEADVFQMENDDAVQVPEDGNAFPIQRDSDDESDDEDGGNRVKSSKSSKDEAEDEPEAESFMDASNLELSSENEDDE